MQMKLEGIKMTNNLILLFYLTNCFSACSYCILVWSEKMRQLMLRERCWGWAETCNGLERFGRRAVKQSWGGEWLGRGALSLGLGVSTSACISLWAGDFARQTGQGEKTLGLFHFPTLGFIPSTLSTPQFTAACFQLRLNRNALPSLKHCSDSQTSRVSTFLPGLPVPEVTVDHCKNNKDF